MLASTTYHIHHVRKISCSERKAVNREAHKHYADRTSGSVGSMAGVYHVNGI